MDEVYDKLKQINDSNKAKRSEYLKESHKRKLIEIMSRRMKTSFIGALDMFEQHFGEELWGHGKSLEDCDEDEAYWREIWEACRFRILNNGNDQVREVRSDFSFYSVKFQEPFKNQTRIENEKNV